ncbi:PAS domain-containing protein [Parasedimentitalea maritima]|uniref:PAS domain-containing protein n=1 Tax=Parasedimentitalea maritima TaxID=2578117 RepID=A0A6A4RMB9_9RHOB|nr:PAS domain-containing protein [Zongyanglinia marina]KAE9631828.1 PAS domain-containing protein [Zongyanglinia marina]
MFFGSRKGSEHNSGQDKVISMDRFRDGSSLSPIRQAESYWTALRQGEDVPKRSQIDPRGLENILSQTFILERIAPGIARFRLAGQKLNEMAGMEVRGMPLTAFFTPTARKQVSAALEHMFDAPAVVELSLQTEATRNRPSQEARMLLMPLRSDLGDVSRALGVFVSEGNSMKTSQRFNVVATELRPVTPLLKPQKSPASKSPNEVNAGFAETQAKFGDERSVMDEARALVEASRQSMDEARKSLSEIKNPPEKTKQNRSSHLRLVVSRD